MMDPDNRSTTIAPTGLPDFDNKSNVRALDLAGRLVLSVVCAMQNNSHIQKVGGSTKTKNERTGLPVQYYQITEPVTIDLVDHVRNYQLGGGKGKRLELQHVVRGHRKLQHYGVGNLQSEIIWIEPYRRGPETAPMALRDVVLRTE